MTDSQTSKQATFLRGLVEPAHTAVLTMELQNGVVGADALLPALVEEVARTGMLDVARRVTAAARAAGARVVHCTAEMRADGLGQAVNCKIFALSEKMRRETGRTATAVGTPGAELVDGLFDAGDIKVPRMHGMTAFTGTELDAVLRNMGIRTVVVTGVSVNLGIYGTCMSALDLGYQVVVVRDAVAGVPADYAQAVIDNSLAFIATITTADELLATWPQVTASR